MTAVLSLMTTVTRQAAGLTRRGRMFGAGEGRR